MLHGESRFFTNWQMSKEVGHNIFTCEPEETGDTLNDWLEDSGIYNKFQFKLDPENNPQHARIKSTI